MYIFSISKMIFYRRICSKGWIGSENQPDNYSSTKSWKRIQNYIWLKINGIQFLACCLGHCIIFHSRSGQCRRACKRRRQDSLNLGPQKQTNIHLFHAQWNTCVLQRQDRPREVEEDRNLPAYHWQKGRITDWDKYCVKRPVGKFIVFHFGVDYIKR